jgi:hypothetical protein
MGPTGFLMVADMADENTRNQITRNQMMQGAMPGGTPMGVPPGTEPQGGPEANPWQEPPPDGLPPGSGPESLPPDGPGGSLPPQPPAGPLDRWNALISQALTARSRSEAAIAQLYAGHPASALFGKAEVGEEADDPFGRMKRLSDRLEKDISCATGLVADNRTARNFGPAQNLR